MPNPIYRPDPEIDITFFEEMSGSNTLQVVIKAAIYIEEEISTLFDIALACPDVLRKLRLTYEQTCGVAIALGLSRDLQKPLAVVGSIRNRFAHQHRAHFSKADADSLYKAFQTDERQVLHSIWDRMRGTGQMPESYPKKMNEMEPIDRFKLYCTSLRSMIIAAQQKARKDRDRMALI